MVLPDADRAGRAHAERLAQVTWDLELPAADRFRIVVVPLSGLAEGAEIVAWLEEGHSREELLKIVHATATWFPGSAERDRQERRRALTRERVRRHRQWRREAGTTRQGACNAVTRVYA